MHWKLHYGPCIIRLFISYLKRKCTYDIYTDHACTTAYKTKVHYEDTAYKIKEMTN